MLWLAVQLACSPHPSTSSGACGDCHTVDLTGSRHGPGQLDNPLFAEAYGRAQDPWCLTCHTAQGVRCVDCHVSPRRTCASCHQFDLPGTDVPSQDTAAEHAASVFASTPCAGCHDPHQPHGGHDEARVRAAIQVDVWSTASGSRARLSSVRVGHAMPTGDPFRRLVLELCADLACRRITARHVLQRRLVEEPTGWRVAADTRIPPPDPHTGEASVELDLPAGRAWRLTYHYADPRHRSLGNAAWMRVDAGLVRER